MSLPGPRFPVPVFRMFGFRRGAAALRSRCLEAESWKALSGGRVWGGTVLGGTEETPSSAVSGSAFQIVATVRRSPVCGFFHLLRGQWQGLRSILSSQLEFSSGLSRQRGLAADKSLNALVGHH